MCMTLAPLDGTATKTLNQLLQPLFPGPADLRRAAAQKTEWHQSGIVFGPVIVTHGNLHLGTDTGHGGALQAAVKGAFVRVQNDPAGGFQVNRSSFP
jgi:hypothetical protein